MQAEMQDTILSEKDAIEIISTTDISSERYKMSERYSVWNFGRYLYPGSADYKYLVDTKQEYLIAGFQKNPTFEKIQFRHPALRRMYQKTLHRIGDGKNPLQ